MILEKLFSFINRNIHAKRINKFLQNRSIKAIIDIGAHKGEFIQYVLQIEGINKIIAFEPQKKIFNILIENQFSKMYKDENFEDCHNLLIQKKFKLLKSFKFPTLHYEDRLYINELSNV